MKDTYILDESTIYSRRKDFCPFSSPPLAAYIPIVGDEKIERIQNVGHRLKGMKILEINSTAKGGGVAEMLYSSVPFLNLLGIEAEWKIINGRENYFECTKRLHNLLQGMKGSFTNEMKQIYLSQLEELASNNIIDYSPDVVMINDPQPMLLCKYLKRDKETWLWRCHIDLEPVIKSKNGMLRLITNWLNGYDGAIFSAIHYIFPYWLMPKFIIPPFIDPLSEKNRELSQEEINKVLDRYGIDAKQPIITQIGRFDPWKGIDRTIDVYREVRKERKCQLVLAGGIASDDPEGARILAQVYEQTKSEENIHILNLSLENRMENWREVNALQRSSTIIIQPSIREGFGLVITEALWKGKPVIANNTGGIPFQIKKGNTGYFYQNPQRTAQKIIYLLDNPKAAERIGKRGKRYVKEHFLIIDRITDYLMAIEITLNNSSSGKEKIVESITSFYPW